MSEQSLQRRRNRIVASVAAGAAGLAAVGALAFPKGADTQEGSKATTTTTAPNSTSTSEAPRPTVVEARPGSSEAHTRAGNVARQYAETILDYTRNFPGASAFQTPVEGTTDQVRLEVMIPVDVTDEAKAANSSQPYGGYRLWVTGTDSAEQGVGIDPETITSVQVMAVTRANEGPLNAQVPFTDTIVGGVAFNKTGDGSWNVATWSPVGKGPEEFTIGIDNSFDHSAFADSAESMLALAARRTDHILRDAQAQAPIGAEAF